MTNLEILSELEAIKVDWQRLIDRALIVVRHLPSEERCRAEGYWLAQLERMLDNEYQSGTLQSTIDSVRETLEEVNE